MIRQTIGFVKMSGNDQRHVILIADDDWMNRELFEAYLSNAGFDVIAANSGHEALKFARSRQLDLVMLDVRMSDIDGYEVCRQLKADPLTKHIPVAMLTAMRVEEVESEATTIGADAIISKSFELPKILTQVRQLLG